MEEQKNAENGQNKEEKKEDIKEEEKKEEDKKEEDKKEEEKKEEDKKEDIKEEDEKTRKKREKEEKKKKKLEKEKEEKEKRKKEKEEKKKKKLEKEKEEKEKKKEEKEKKKKEKEEKKKEKEEKKKEKEEKKKEKEEQNANEKINIIYAIDEENKKCVDCGAENPTKTSINHGIIICENCAKEHEQLGHSISFLKNIDDDFDEFLINFIIMGSNTKFKRFLTQENVDSNLPIKSKYMTQAVCYYRKNLKAKTEGKKELEKDYKDANEILENEEENIFPEFNKKYVLKNQVLRKGTVLSQHRFTFRNIFNKVFIRNKKKKRGRSFEKDKKKSNMDYEIDMNKTSPPELMGENKEVNMLESNRPFQDDDKKEEDKKDENTQNTITTTSIKK